jgi:antirestriction protein ArdC
MKTHPKVKPTLDLILELFRSDNVPETVAIATFPPFDVPSNSWSLTNRILMALHGSSDCRGYKQWLEVDRFVCKGSKAVHILAPWLSNKNDDDNDKQDRPHHISKILRGFLAVPVFKVEDTSGEPLDYQHLELPELPLLAVAEKWGLDVAAVAFQGGWYGYYQPDRKQIRLATPEEKTFFHELAHAAHQHVIGQLKPGQDWQQEVVAELSAQALCCIVGTQPGKTIGNSFEYISNYAEKAGKQTVNACLSVLSDIEKVLSLILMETQVQHPPSKCPSKPDPSGSTN